MTKLIEPRTLKGFRDYPPDLMIPREWLIESARRVYRSYGFAPIDTPALEYAEVLLGKMDADAEIQRQLYRFQDHGKRDVALRFDLTVPFARFAAQHIANLGTPFKRYHIGPVWRGENTQAGRYREFLQCDFDTIGTSANAADIETALVIHDLMSALGFEGFEIRVNNRLLLNGVLESLGLLDRSATILRSLDKLAKQGVDVVKRELSLPIADRGAGLTAEQSQAVICVAQQRGEPEEILSAIASRYGQNPRVSEGVGKLRELFTAARIVGVPESRLRLDTGICRGLDYYTGTIFETFLTDLPSIGSVCSGGRYDNLAGLYTRQSLPGVGASLGLDRLLAAMEELKLLPRVSTPAEVLILNFDTAGYGDFQRLARGLRQAGIATEVYSDAKKLGPQLQYAERKGFQLAIIAGPDERARGECKIKVLSTREEVVVTESNLIDAVQSRLRSGGAGRGP